MFAEMNEGDAAPEAPAVSEQGSALEGGTLSDVDGPQEPDDESGDKSCAEADFPLESNSNEAFEKVTVPSPVADPAHPVALDEDKWPKVTYDPKENAVGVQLYDAEVKLHLEDPLPLVERCTFQECDLPEVVTLAPPSAVKTPSIKSRKLNKKTPKSARARNAELTGPSKTIVKLEPAKSMPLPDTVFRQLDDYPAIVVPERPACYYRFIEKTSDELEDEVEYDMDEEDCLWLEYMNRLRMKASLPPVSTDDFELLMDRLEKESIFQHANGGPDSPPIDDEAICCICMDGDCENTNVILFCDMCNLPVHQECYGVPYIPEGQWLCRRCLQSPSQAVDCALCPNKGGAFKQTSDGRWAHVVCAIWIPEVCFANTVFLEPVDNIKNIPAARWRLTCYICKQKGRGACIQCNKNNCYTAFHVTCAQQAGLSMKIDASRDASGAKLNVKKSAFCDVHGPCDGDGPMAADASIISDSPKDPERELFRERLRKARKILAERRTVAPTVSVPTLPPEKVVKLADLISVANRNLFFRKLMAYWLMKRKARNGVPLIRRLQSAQNTRKPSSAQPQLQPGASESRLGSEVDESGTDVGSGDEEPASVEPTKNIRNRNQKRKASPEIIVVSRKKRKRDPECADIGKPALAVPEDVKHEFTFCRKIRQDLERARLLCELVRKRERLKRERVAIMERVFLIRYYPVIAFARHLLEMLHGLDKDRIFAEPVDTKLVDDYLDVIKEPMDLSTLRRKLEDGEYRTINALAADYHLMMRNCMTYNAKDTYYYKEAARQREAGQILIRQTKRLLREAGFDDETGLLSERPTAEDLSSNEARMRDAEALVRGDSDRGRDRDRDRDGSLKQKVDNLLEAEAILLLLPKSVSRACRLKQIKLELRRLRMAIARLSVKSPRSCKVKTDACVSVSDASIASPAFVETCSDDGSRSLPGPKRDKESSSHPAVQRNVEEGPTAMELDVVLSPPPPRLPWPGEDNPARCDSDGDRKYRHSQLEPRGRRKMAARNCNRSLNGTSRCEAVPSGDDDVRAESDPDVDDLELPPTHFLNASAHECGMKPVSVPGTISCGVSAVAAVKTPELKPRNSENPRRVGRKTSPRQRKISDWLKPPAIHDEQVEAGVEAAASKKALFAEVLGDGDPSEVTSTDASSRTKPSFSTYRNQASVEENSRGGRSDDDDDNRGGSSPDVSSSNCSWSDDADAEGNDDDDDDDVDAACAHDSSRSRLTLAEKECSIRDSKSAQNDLEGTISKLGSNEQHEDCSCRRDVLKPNDLVWAKQGEGQEKSSFLWFPAVLADCGDVPVAEAEKVMPPPSRPHGKDVDVDARFRLVRLFDEKRSWRWVGDESIVPLGIDSETDKEMITKGQGQHGDLVEPGTGNVCGNDGSENPVRRAYERAVLYYSDISVKCKKHDVD